MGQPLPNPGEKPPAIKSPTQLLVLVVSAAEETREMVHFALDLRFRCIIEHCATAEEAKKILCDRAGNFSAVLCDLNWPGGEELQRFADTEIGKRAANYIFWCSGRGKASMAPGTQRATQLFIDQHNLFERINKEFLQRFPLAIRPKEPGADSLAMGSYCRVRAQLLVGVGDLGSDVYISLSDDKFVKILRKGDDFNEKDLQKYHVIKGQEYLYIAQNDVADVLVQLKNLILDVVTPFRKSSVTRTHLSSVPPLSSVKVDEAPPQTSSKVEQAPESFVASKEMISAILNGTPMPSIPSPTPPKLEVVPVPARATTRAETLSNLESNFAGAIEAIHEMSRRTGFTPEVREATLAAVDCSLAILKRSTQISGLLARFKRGKGKYIAAHSVLSGQIACLLASEMEWSSDATFQKLTIAAMLHDIVLQNERLARMSTLEEAKKASARKEITKEELEEYRTHPQKCAEIAKTFADIPPDVDAIIMDHHEKANGMGFPRSLPFSRISPLSAVFIVAHDLTDAIWDRDPHMPFTGDFMKEFFEQNQGSYQLGNFRKILRVIPKLKV